MNNKVSIIVPVYNVAQYLDRCLDSIVHQTYEQLEILLVDDGSQDGSSQICDTWAVKDPRIVVMHQKNTGMGEARNVGMMRASGEYLLFVDSDDYLPRDAVETLVDAVLRDGSDAAIGGYLSVYEDGRDSKFHGNWCKSGIVDGMSILSSENGYECPVAVWAKLFRHNVFEDLAFPRLKCGEDLWVHPFIMQKCRKVSIVDTPVYYYFRHTASIMNNRSDDYKLDETKATLHMVKCLLTWECTANAYRWYDRAILQIMGFKRRKMAQTVLCENLSKEQRAFLYSGLCIKRKIATISVFIPGLFHIYRALARKAHNNR